jgi:hypothetical protein
VNAALSRAAFLGESSYMHSKYVIFHSNSLDINLLKKIFVVIPRRNAAMQWLALSLPRRRHRRAAARKIAF